MVAEGHWCDEGGKRKPGTGFKWENGEGGGTERGMEGDGGGGGEEGRREGR